MMRYILFILLLWWWYADRTVTFQANPVITYDVSQSSEWIDYFSIQWWIYKPWVWVVPYEDSVSTQWMLTPALHPSIKWFTTIKAYWDSINQGTIYARSCTWDKIVWWSQDIDVSSLWSCITIHVVQPRGVLYQTIQIYWYADPLTHIRVQKNWCYFTWYLRTNYFEQTNVALGVNSWSLAWNPYRKFWSYDDYVFAPGSYLTWITLKPGKPFVFTWYSCDWYFTVYSSQYTQNSIWMPMIVTQKQWEMQSMSSFLLTTWNNLIFAGKDVLYKGFGVSITWRNLWNNRQLLVVSWSNWYIVPYKNWQYLAPFWIPKQYVVWTISWLITDAQQYARVSLMSCTWDAEFARTQTISGWVFGISGVPIGQYRLRILPDPYITISTWDFVDWYTSCFMFTWDREFGGAVRAVPWSIGISMSSSSWAISKQLIVWQKLELQINVTHEWWWNMKDIQVFMPPILSGMTIVSKKRVWFGTLTATGLLWTMPYMRSWESISLEIVWWTKRVGKQVLSASIVWVIWLDTTTWSWYSCGSGCVSSWQNIALFDLTTMQGRADLQVTHLINNESVYETIVDQPIFFATILSHKWWEKIDDIEIEIVPPPSVTIDESSATITYGYLLRKRWKLYRTLDTMFSGMIDTLTFRWSATQPGIYLSRSSLYSYWWVDSSSPLEPSYLWVISWANHARAKLIVKPKNSCGNRTIEIWEQCDQWGTWMIQWGAYDGSTCTNLCMIHNLVWLPQCSAYQLPIIMSGQSAPVRFQADSIAYSAPLCDTNSIWKWLAPSAQCVRRVYNNSQQWQVYVVPCTSKIPENFPFPTFMMMWLVQIPVYGKDISVQFEWVIAKTCDEIIDTKWSIIWSVPSEKTKTLKWPFCAQKIQSR